MNKEIQPRYNQDYYERRVKYCTNTLECMLRLNEEGHELISEEIIEKAKESLRMAIENKISFEQTMGGERLNG